MMTTCGMWRGREEAMEKKMTTDNNKKHYLNERKKDSFIIHYPHSTTFSFHCLVFLQSKQINSKSIYCRT